MRSADCVKSDAAPARHFPDRFLSPFPSVPVRAQAGLFHASAEHPVSGMPLPHGEAMAAVDEVKDYRLSYDLAWMRKR